MKKAAPIAATLQVLNQERQAAPRCPVCGGEAHFMHGDKRLKMYQCVGCREYFSISPASQTYAAD